MSWDLGLDSTFFLHSILDFICVSFRRRRPLANYEWWQSFSRWLPCVFMFKRVEICAAIGRRDRRINEQKHKSPVRWKTNVKRWNWMFATVFGYFLYLLRINIIPLRFLFYFTSLSLSSDVSRLTWKLQKQESDW